MHLRLLFTLASMLASTALSCSNHSTFTYNVSETTVAICEYLQRMRTSDLHAAAIIANTIQGLLAAGHNPLHASDKEHPLRMLHELYVSELPHLRGIVHTLIRSFLAYGGPDTLRKIEKPPHPATSTMHALAAIFKRNSLYARIIISDTTATQLAQELEVLMQEQPDPITYCHTMHEALILAAGLGREAHAAVLITTLAHLERTPFYTSAMHAYHTREEVHALLETLITRLADRRADPYRRIAQLLANTEPAASPVESGNNSVE